MHSFNRINERSFAAKGADGKARRDPMLEMTARIKNIIWMMRRTRVLASTPGKERFRVRMGMGIFQVHGLGWGKRGTVLETRSLLTSAFSSIFNHQRHISMLTAFFVHVRIASILTLERTLPGPMFSIYTHFLRLSQLPLLFPITLLRSTIDSHPHLRSPSK